MKKFIILLTILSSTSIYAEIFGTASTLREGTAMIGAEVQGYIDPNDFISNFHLGYGIIDDLDIDLRLGAGTTPFYFGGDLEYQFLRHEWLDISLSVGAHHQEEMFLDITPIISHRFLRFSVSTGLDINWRLSGGKLLSMNWFFGTAVPILRGVDLIVETGIKLKDAPYWVSGGLALYF